MQGVYSKCVCIKNTTKLSVQEFPDMVHKMLSEVLLGLFVATKNKLG